MENLWKSVSSKSTGEEPADLIGTKQAMCLFLTAVECPHGCGIIEAEKSGLNLMIRVDYKQAVFANRIADERKRIEEVQSCARFPEKTARIAAEDDGFVSPCPLTKRLEAGILRKQAHRHLSIRRICRSTLSDFHRIADPDHPSPESPPHRADDRDDESQAASLALGHTLCARLTAELNWPIPQTEWHVREAGHAGFGVVLQQAVAAIVIEDVGILEGVRRGWEVVKRNVGPVALIWLILMVVGFVIGILLALPVLVTVIPAAIAYGASGQQPGTAALIVGGVCLAVYIPVYLILYGILTAYVESAWALTYLRLTRPKESNPTSAALPVMR